MGRKSYAVPSQPRTGRNMTVIWIAIANAILWGVIIALLIARMQDARRLEDQIERVEAAVIEAGADNS